jgi:hypothetical protein
MTNFSDADHPRVDNGTFTDKPQTSPEIPPLEGDRVAEFGDVFTAVPFGPDGDTVHQDYESALAAAGGDDHRVFTVVDGGYPDGDGKVWVFDNDGDEHIVQAETEDEAREMAHSLAHEGDDDDDDDDDSDEGEPGEGYDLRGVHYPQDDIFDTDSYVEAPDTYALPGRRTVNAIGFVVTEARWVDDSTEYAW